MPAHWNAYEWRASQLGTGVESGEKWQKENLSSFGAPSAPFWMEVLTPALYFAKFRKYSSVSL